MTCARLVAFLLLVLAASSAAASPRIQTWQTDNGARVYFVESHELPMVDVRVVFDAASAREPADRGGLALLTNAMLEQGTGDMDADAVAEGFERLGVEFSASSLRDMAGINLRSLSDANLLEPAVDLAAAVLSAPSFPEASLERERQRALIALQQQRQSPGDIAERLFYAKLYGDHPYARPPEGSEEGMKAITRDDLVNFHRQYYVGANAVVAVVGDLDREGAQRLAARLVAGLPAGAAPGPLPPVAGVDDARREDVAFPSTQTHLLMGQPGMSRKDPDYFTLYVGNYVLGGGGLISRLAEQVREQRGLAYSVYSYFMPMRAQGPFIIGLQTRSDQIDQALGVVRDTVTGFVENGPTDEELVAAKRNLTGGFPLRIDSNGKICEYLAVIGFYDLPLTYLDDFPGKVEAVTLEGIKDAFRRRVHPGRMLTVTVGAPAEGSAGS